MAKLVTRYCNSAPVKYSTLYSLFYIENSVYSIVFARLSWRSTIVTQALSNPRYGSDTISEVVAALQQHLLLCSMVIVWLAGKKNKEKESWVAKLESLKEELQAPSAVCAFLKKGADSARYALFPHSAGIFHPQCRAR